MGTFKPDLKDANIWDIPTDYYLHHSSTMNLKSFAFRQRYQTEFIFFIKILYKIFEQERVGLNVWSAELIEVFAYLAETF